MFIGERLADLRKDKGMGQLALASVLGINRERLSTYERGKHKPPIDIVEKAAVYFDVSIDYLMGLSDDHISYNRKDAISLPKGFPDDAIPKVREYIGLLLNEHKSKK